MIDGGNLPLKASTTATIIIEDINDEKPTFTKDLFRFYLPENQDVEGCNVYVGDVVAVDNDKTVVNRKMQYSILYVNDNFESNLSTNSLDISSIHSFKIPLNYSSTNAVHHSSFHKTPSAPTDIPLFFINPHNGSLYACRSFDREFKDTHKLQLYVSDLGNSNLYDKAEVKWKKRGFRFFLIRLK